MSFIALPLGLLLPTLSGWLALRIIEGNTPVLLRAERWVLGFLLGWTLTAYVTFLAAWSGIIRITLPGMAMVQIALCGILAAIAWRMRAAVRAFAPNAPTDIARMMKIAIGILAAWMTVKLLAAAVMLLGSPPYFDDVYSNWNLRGKIFAFTGEILQRTGNDPAGAVLGGVHSYPPTVPLLKAWLALIAGKWTEWLANAPHMLWYLALLTLVFCTLRRKMSLPWALLGIYVLSSLPMIQVHAGSAYAEIFTAGHVFAVAALLMHALSAPDARNAKSFFRLAAFAAALLTFTKNEGLVLYMPAVGALMLFTATLLWRRGTWTAKETLMALVLFAVIIAAVAVPWTAYKWMYGLTFGNAKGIWGLEIHFEPLAIQAMWINTYFEGNWLLLPVILPALVLLRWRAALRPPVLGLLGFFLLVTGTQVAIFSLTPLSTEAMQQTGFARGLVQLAPIATVVAVMLARDWWRSFRH